MLHGMKQAIYAVSTMGQRINLSTLENKLECTVESLSRFPVQSRDNLDLLELSKSLTSDSTMSLVTAIMSHYVGSDEGKDLVSPTSSLRKCGLLYLANHCLTKGLLDSKSISLLADIFGCYVTSWVEMENLQREKELLEASLYKYKEVTHGDVRTEEEIENDELALNFPSFQQDFEDVIVGFTLDDKPKPKTQKTQNASNVQIGTEFITEKEMFELAAVHHNLFCSLTKTDWLQSNQNASDVTIDHIEPFITGYKCAASLIRKAGPLMLSGLDARLIGAHILAGRIIENGVDQTLESETSLKSVKSKPYDIYHDSNVPEVILCQPILEEFSTAVNKLLVEWPDHPTLKQLLLVIGRILSFPITAPLMKFVTGLETLLQKAQEWEANAAKHVSLQTQLEAVTNQIIDWRKLELKSWDSCLKMVEWKTKENAAKWWLHLYNLLQSYINSEQDHHDNEASDGEDNKERKELIEALQKFMEGATLGEYSVRLDMIYAFHCQIAHMQSSEKQGDVLHILWNIYQYFSHFKPTIEELIASQRDPLHKQLKNFVKIAKWNDINFFAMKQAVEKTHRTLAKYMRQYRMILHQPVKNSLAEKKENTEQKIETVNHEKAKTKPKYEMDSSAQDTQKMAVENTEPSISEGLKLLKMSDPQQYLIQTAETLTDGKEELIIKDSILGKLPTLTRRIRQHSSSLMVDTKYQNLLTGLEELTDEVQSTVKELATLEVNQEHDKEKQKSEAKQINLRKRKALAELFKYLALLGLSYRKGLMMSQHREETDIMLMKPVDFMVALDQFSTNECDTHLGETWRGCPGYMYKCVARRAQFQVALQSPAKDLGLDNISRCRGFIEHILTLSQQQHNHVASVATPFIQLRKCLESLSKFTSSDEQYVPPQDQSRVHIDCLHSLLTATVTTLDHFLILLHCSPKQPDGETKYMSPFLKSSHSKMAILHQGDLILVNVLQKLREMKEDVIKQNAVILSLVANTSSNVSLVTHGDLKIIASVYNMLSSYVPYLVEIQELFSLPSNINNEAMSMTESLTLLRENISIRESEFTTFRSTINQSHDNAKGQSDNTDLNENKSQVEDVESLITEVLLGVQNILKTETARKVSAGSEHATSEEEANNGRDEEDVELVKNHLTECLQKHLEVDLDAINLHKVLNRFTSLINHIKLGHNFKSFSKLLSHCQPLLDQYCLLVEFFVTKSVATYRGTTKLMSVLLGLFTQLAAKGFCLPAEFSDESQEGATEFSEIESGGLGDGEGQKDVSDQIETEDQLEDAFKQGEEKKEEDHANEPDVEEEDNAIEMSEDFDGKTQDGDKQEKGSEDEEENDDQDELDKQMGDVDDNEDKLDEQIWGDDEPEDQEQKDTKDEVGEGAGPETESELVANQDNQDQADRDKEDQNKEKQSENLEEKINEQDQVDESEYNENEVDPYHGDQEKLPEPEALDLPDDLNLDENDADGKDNESENEEETPHDIDVMKEEGASQEGEEEPMDTDNPDEVKQSDETDENGPEQESPVEPPEQETTERPPSEEVTMETSAEDEGGKDGNESRIDPQKEDDELNKEDEKPTEDEKNDESIEAAESYDKTKHTSQNVEQSDSSHDAAGQSDNTQEEKDGTGVSEHEQAEGHEGHDSQVVSKGGADANQQPSKRKPGTAEKDRSLGSTDEQVKKRLKTVDSKNEAKQQEQKAEEAGLYEHIKDSESHYDTQTMDVATDDQQQPMADHYESEDEENVDDNNIAPEKDISVDDVNERKPSASLQRKLMENQGAGDDEETDGRDEKINTDGERVDTQMVPRSIESTIHTQLETLHGGDIELDVEQLRKDLEQQLQSWRQSTTKQEELEAQEAWLKYEAVTSSLSQELCEQLRLILEPSQATKLRGDYRTGKRLNMRKVIPYIASQFRKDKIWLRRTKPSKRQYQIMLAIDDSSSMDDNHSRQLAFESLAVISNALSLLESGELGICSFGETVQLLHPFNEQFSNQSGAGILRQFTFEQKKTKIALLLDQITSIMVNARNRQRGVLHPDVSQLLLVISDGRGLFTEGMEIVQSAVRQARQANVFLVFVILDNPENKDSILDIKVPIFKGGQLPQITPYMDHFPFPFYIILRDINSLPVTLSDALRQWFEIVTASDK
ncbi:unnamed protein product [Owenia fusiformis]|uniref:Uncharacterized protein n=1 Tax=Owenia fusiformis TaxID=6347 RepID=A0A8J1TEC4_OWEFU|nr:unnamed protein product [Owenia fusiformis]